MSQAAMPLAGVRVLDLSRLLPGPFASMVLAGLGAEVTKVEDLEGGDYLRWLGAPGGDASAMFTALNRGKRSVRLDLKTARGRELFLAMTERADVVLESFRPGVMDRLGLGLDDLQQRNSAIILCSISGFGQDGPDRLRAGHDLNYLARSGILGITGTRDGALAIPGVQVGDLGGGGLGAVVAILAALRLRERTGRGSWCDVSMLDGLLAWVGPQLAAQREAVESPGPGRMLLNGAFPCYRAYRCADGWMTVAALEPKFWTRLCELLGLEDISDGAFAGGTAGEAVAQRLEAVLITRTREEWRSHFDGADVCCEPVLTLAEVADDPQVRHRSTPREPAAWFPVRVGGASAPLGDAPGHGADSRSVLAEVGVNAAEFDRLVAERVTA